MRRSNGIKLIRYLMAGWVIGNVTLIIMIYVMHGIIDHSEWMVIISTACVTGGVFFNIYDVWLFEEFRSQKKRSGGGYRL